MRITKEKLRDRIERLQKLGFDIQISWAYGQPRLSMIDLKRDISPRLQVAAMNDWIDGFETGAQEQRERQKQTIEYALQYISKGIADKAFDGCVIDPKFVVNRLEALL